MKTNQVGKHNKALTFAQALQETDAEHLANCIKDMKELAKLDEDSAKIVAAAIREKNIPELAKQAGIDPELLGKLISPMQNKAVDFADKVEKEKDIDKGNDHLEPDEDNFGGESDNDEDNGLNTEDEDVEIGNEDDLPVVDDTAPEGLLDSDEAIVGDDENSATIEIKLPASMVDEFQAKLQALISEQFGDGSIDDTDGIPGELEDKTPGFPIEDNAEEDENNDFSADTNDDELNEEDNSSDKEENITRSNEMNTEASTSIDKAQRKANREKILRQASEEVQKPKDIGLGQDTSFNGKPFEHSEKAQPKGEDELPAMKLKNSEGNSLYEDPGYTKISIPTQNPDNLQLKNSYEKFTFSGGGGDNGLEYSADFSEMNEIPSAGDFATDDKFELPTQLGDDVRTRKTTVAKVVECSGCNNPQRVAVDAVECEDCKTVLALCTSCQDEEYCPTCATRTAAPKKAEDEIVEDAEVEAKTKKESDLKIRKNPEELLQEIEPESIDPKQVTLEKGAMNYTSESARLRVAWRVAMELVNKNIVNMEQAENYVHGWMEDKIPARAIKAQGELAIRAASNIAEKIVAENIQEKPDMSQARVASSKVNRISANPSFVTNENVRTSAVNTGGGELTQTLENMFMEKFSTYEKEKDEEKFGRYI